MTASSPRRCVWLWILLLSCLLGTHAIAESPANPSDERVRAAIVKGLGFLAKAGDTWMDERNCNGCHHMPELLWSHREAKRRGITIDQKQFDEFVGWADERARDVKAGAEVLAFMKLAMPERPMPELVKLIVDRQQPDGSWKPAGQFASMQRRATPEATENSARVFLLALGTQPADQAVTEAARAKAAALLEKKEPAKSVETLVYRAHYSRRFGAPEETASLRTEILKLQHPDGGWGWMIEETQSDSLATGQVLYLLQQAPDSESKDAIERASKWLIERQSEDGSWPIDITRISKIDRSAPAKAKSLKEATGIYTYWGSAWATLGLLEGLPVVP